MHFILGNAQQILAIIQDLAALHDGVAGQNADDGLGGDGFAGAGFAHDGKRFAPFQIKGDIADGLQGAVGGAEGDPQVFHFKNLIHLLFLHTAQRGVERIAQTVAKQVKADHQQGDNHDL